MEKRAINPWTWQDRYEFVQANEVSGAKKMLFCAGQISVDENGNILHPYDMEKQMMQILDNLEIIFEQAGIEFSNVVRITYFTTDIQAFGKANLEKLSKRMKELECKAATTLIGVSALAREESVVEFEVTAMV